MTIERDTPPPMRPRPFAGPAPSHAPVPPRRRRWPLIAGAVLILGAFAIAGVLLLGPRTGGTAPVMAHRTAGPAVISQAGVDAIETTTLSPDEIRPITPDEARAFNAGVPFSGLPIIAAKPFIMPADKLEDYVRALDCLTAAVYYEAATETAAGQAAVAQVVVNRMRHPAYPKTICGVIFQGAERKTGCQFSFTCDGAMDRKPSVEGWARARLAATAALNGYVASGVGMATHYHTDWVAPYWAERLVKMRQIGAHIFYRWGGGWGLPPAFTGRHADLEPTVAKMALVVAPLDPLGLADEVSPVLPASPPVLISVAPLSTSPSVASPVSSSAPTTPVQPASRPVTVATPVAAASPNAPAVRPTIENPLTTGTTEATPRRRSRIAAPS